MLATIAGMKRQLKVPVEAQSPQRPRQGSDGLNLLIPDNLRPTAPGP